MFQPVLFKGLLETTSFREEMKKRQVLDLGRTAHSRGTVLRKETLIEGLPSLSHTEPGRTDLGKPKVSADACSVSALSALQDTSLACCSSQCPGAHNKLAVTWNCKVHGPQAALGPGGPFASLLSSRLLTEIT